MLTTSSKKAGSSPQQTHRYKLKFVPDAWKEWQALDGSVKEPLRKLLKKRLGEPRVPGAELRGELQDCYKIKLLKQGYRLVYEIINNEVVVLVLAIDRRDGAVVYQSAINRVKEKMIALTKAIDSKADIRSRTTTKK